MPDSVWWQLLPPLLLSLGTSLLVERLLVPRPVFLSRPLAAHALHGGIWLCLFALAVALLQRPIFAAGALLAGFLVVTLVNNAKVHSLREPFVFADFEYFTDALKHPRLYLPFLGVGRACAGSAAIGLVAYWGITTERALWQDAELAKVLTALTWLAGGGVTILWLANRKGISASLEPSDDMKRLGLVASLWIYGREHLYGHRFDFSRSPFDLPAPEAKQTRPDFVVIQSESFFDARRLRTEIRHDVLKNFDRIGQRATRAGRLNVPAWGANTVRTEFAFLSGINPDNLGVHRFNPYRLIGRRHVDTIATYFKRAGYRTICVHPYPASFYSRDKVFPRMGFDEFIDIAAFDPAKTAGQYISDTAVAEKVLELQQTASGPVFIFAITMENHGPLHLERSANEDQALAYVSDAKEISRDLTVYLKHLRNADQMLGMLESAFDQSTRPVCTCFYGDHVPIMPDIYARSGYSDGRTDYVIWHNRCSPQPRLNAELATHDLALALISQCTQRISQ